MEKKRLIKKKERLITASSLLLAPLKLILIITHTHQRTDSAQTFFNFCYPSLAIEKERTPSPLKTHTHMQKKKLQKN